MQNIVNFLEKVPWPYFLLNGKDVRRWGYRAG